jgi:hypothetical protein
MEEKTQMVNYHRDKLNIQPFLSSDGHSYELQSLDVIINGTLRVYRFHFKT